GPDVIGEEVFWRPEPNGPRTDMHHLNALCCRRGDLLVSGFGKKVDRFWRSARDGFIVNVTRGQKLTSGIYHPHSLITLGDTIIYCESGLLTVRALAGGRIRQLPGYTRGLCCIGNDLYVGTSSRRSISKSTGANVDPGPADGPPDRCTISRLALESFTVED